MQQNYKLVLSDVVPRQGLTPSLFASKQASILSAPLARSKLPGVSYFVIGGDTDDRGDPSDGHGMVEANQFPRDELWIHSSALPKLLEITQSRAIDWIGTLPETTTVGSATLDRSLSCQKRQVRSLVKRMEPAEIRTSIPLGIWQGEIQLVDEVERSFSAKLVPLRGSNADMSGDISFNQVNVEDHKLIIPGAVFYIEQYSRLNRRQVSYEQLVRFRRASVWTAAMVKEVATRADDLAEALVEALKHVRYAEG